MHTRLVAMLLAGTLALAAPVAQAGRIVVNHDEWTLSNTGAANAGAANVSTFIANLASFMNIDGGTCNFLVYSSNFGLTQSAFTSGMTSAGCALTFYTGAFNVGAGTLANYDGVFLGLPPATYVPATLATYVNSGGSAYIMAGTAEIAGGAGPEAAHWNAFLNGFGLNLTAPYNLLLNVIDPVQVSHQLETGVNQLFYNNGNTVTLIGGNPNAQIIEFSGNGLGVLGVFDDVVVTQVPAPATLLCLGLGLLAMGGARRRGRFERH